MTDRQQTIELYEHNCCICQGWIEQKKGGRLRRTCSAACRQKLYRMRKGEAEKKGRKRAKWIEAGVGQAGQSCPACGEPMAQPAQGRRRKTCSQRCRMKLWRQQNPRCVLCRKRFRRNRYQKNHQYCSEQCQSKAKKIRQRQRAREREFAKLGSWRPDWIPRPGSGYREETIPWAEDMTEEEAVIREREANVNHREPAKTPTERLEERAERLAEERRKLEEEKKRAEKARKLAYELLVDESKWRKW